MKERFEKTLEVVKQAYGDDVDKLQRNLAATIICIEDAAEYILTVKRCINVMGEHAKLCFESGKELQSFIE